MSRLLFILLLGGCVADGTDVAATSEGLITATHYGWGWGVVLSPWNAAGAIDATAIGVGRTSWVFHGVNNQIGSTANIQVATGQPGADPGSDQATYCKVESASTSGGNLTVITHCYLWDGTDHDGAVPIVSWVSAEAPAAVGSTMTKRPGAGGLYQFPSGTHTPIHTGTGQYTVTYPGLTGTVGTNAQVTAYGNNNYRCQIASWGAGTANVTCTNPLGQLKDTDFNLLYTSNTTAIAGSGGSLWANGLTTPTADISYNSTHGTNTVEYGYPSLNHFPGVDGRSMTDVGTVQLTAVGNAGEFCNLRLWVGEFHVYCYNSSGGALGAAGRYSASRLWESF